jgi:hypothetical protein
MIYFCSVCRIVIIMLKHSKKTCPPITQRTIAIAGGNNTPFTFLTSSVGSLAGGIQLIQELINKGKA